MWDELRIPRFMLLDGVVKEEIYQNGIDMGMRVLTQYLPSDEFDTPYAAAA